MSLETKLEQLNKNLMDMGSILVAFSGGVDSSLILKIAYELLGDRVLAVTAISPSLPESERAEAEAIVRSIGARHVWINSHEIEDERYLSNTPNRCFFCKNDLYGLLNEMAQKENLRYIVDGTNADDAGDHRPGRKAAREHGVRSPFLEAGMTKDEIRQLSRLKGLPNWDKPAAACLSSRVPYGTHISIELLSQIERAERFLQGLGLRQLRVRHHDQVARIEVPLEEFPTVLAQREAIIAAFREIGYNYITLDLAGFRSGSMNETLSAHERVVERAQ